MSGVPQSGRVPPFWPGTYPLRQDRDGCGALMSGSLGAWVGAGAWAQGRTTVLNDLCDPGWRGPLSGPCFLHLYLPEMRETT